MVYLFLADGFEMIEALSPVDMLRRASVDILTVGVTGKYVKSSSDVTVESDILLKDVRLENLEAVILPGGALGVENLENSLEVQNIINYAEENGVLLCAICAAPSVLGKKGILKNINATAYPSFQKYLYEAKLSEDYVVTDKNIITARGAGVSVDFALEIVKQLRGESVSESIRDAIQCR